MNYQKSCGLAALACVLLGGCVSIPADRGAANSRALVESRSAAAGSVLLAPSATEEEAEFTARLLAAPLGATEAVQLALLNSPRMRLLYAQLGLVQGEVYDATRLANPTLGYLRLTPDVGSSAKTTWSIAQSFTEVLFLGYRNRMGRAQALRAEQQVAYAVLQLEADVREAYYLHAGAQLAARMRAAAARGARTAADLAVRFHEAGNVTLLQRSREEAVASEASIGARKLAANAVVARGRLLTLLGLDLDDARARFVDELALPTAFAADLSSLLALADSQRLDLAALRTEVDLRQQQLTHVGRWRWLSGLTVRAERETELDGSVIAGPGASLELPVFNTGKGAYLRSSALAETSAARLAGLETEIRNDISVQFAALEAARLAVDEFRTQLLPLQQRIVASSQREQNFMLIGAFELLAARREEIDTYERYVEAVRDYWIERTRLARSVGGALPGDQSPGDRLILPDLPGESSPGIVPTMLPGGAQ